MSKQIKGSLDEIVEAVMEKFKTNGLEMNMIQAYAVYTAIRTALERFVVEEELSNFKLK